MKFWIAFANTNYIVKVRMQQLEKFDSVGARTYTSHNSYNIGVQF